ncbi:IclR family transcriptional regulator [Pseudonocardia ailaonensis]|uniref:IclR family transcriptional regulator n=1 Tax=Pseudonocardia ailaonensis TaxID=367279 RepID=A0ABN2NGB7_9PSEU
MPEQEIAGQETDAGSRSGLARALTVIELIAERSPETMGLSVLARDLSLSKSVTHRILKELVALDFLAFDPATKHYRLGSGALQVGLAALRGLDVPRLARPYLRRLVQRTSETATLSVRQGWGRVYIDQVLSPHEIRMSVVLGTSHALHAGSSSKAILAGLPDADVDEYLESHALDPVTAATITSVDALRTEITHIREVGYALSSGERQAGAGSVAAPVHLANGDVFGSISLCGPIDRFRPDVAAAHGALVAETARRISAELGHRASMKEA